MTKPHVALITNVEPVHLRHFKSAQEIASAKSEIFAGCIPGAIAVLNLDNAWFDDCAEAAEAAGIGEIITFGRDPNADMHQISVVPRADGSDVIATIKDVNIAYSLRAVGDHWASNSLGVLACVHALGLDSQAAADTLGQVTAGPGRGERSEITLAGGGTVTLIDESYNASPPAMAAAFRVLAMTSPQHGGRRIAVLGDMRELGDRAPNLHAQLAGSLFGAAPDLVFTVGPLMTHLRDLLPAEILGDHGARSEDIAAVVALEIADGDVILIKGSLGTNMAPIVAAIRALDTSGGRG
jgi:UDP-N-acetylmuramoyl-tripeptide--D-alanyl-D-alanine ligase